MARSGQQQDANNIEGKNKQFEEVTNNFGWKYFLFNHPILITFGTRFSGLLFNIDRMESRTDFHIFVFRVKTAVNRKL